MKELPWLSLRKGKNIGDLVVNAMVKTKEVDRGHVGEGVSCVGA